MEAAPTPSPTPGSSPDGPLRAFLAEAARFWEPRRIIYNLVLTAVAVIWVAASWPHFRPAFKLEPLFLLCILALIANALYSAAYFVDIPLQYTSAQGTRNRFRWGLFVLGTVFAVLLENYWIADEIYPFVQ